MDRKEEPLKEVSPEEIPDFASEEEEAEFWATHTLNDEFWDEAERTPREELPPSLRRRKRRKS